MAKQHRKFLNFGDLHFGYQKSISPSGRQRVKPVHDMVAFNAMMQFARAYKPDVISLVGDLFDMKPVSRHDMETPKKLEGQRLVEVYRDGFTQFIEPILNLPGSPEIHWFDGNHEAWAYQLTNKFPGISGMLDPYTYLNLREENVKFHPQGDVMKLGKLGICHGDGLVRGGGKYAAASAVDRYGSSIRIWHFHTWQVYIKPTLKNGAYQSGVVVPCLCDTAPEYAPAPHINSWVKGFNYGVVEPNGNFSDAVAVIYNGKVVIDGKTYSGRAA